jgi:hypothetical protein
MLCRVGAAHFLQASSLQSFAHLAWFPVFKLGDLTITISSQRIIQQLLAFFLATLEKAGNVKV